MAQRVARHVRYADLPGRRIIITYASSPLDILVVEDEALLAMDIEAMIEDAGHSVVAEAASLFDVEALDTSLKPHLALVDIQLARGTSGLDVSRLIRNRWSGTMIVFLTANPLKIPPDFAGAHGVIAKPFSRNGLMSALAFLEEAICNPPPSREAPQSFVPSGAFEMNRS